jgi:two-component system, cell cycle response regulator DivK
MNTVLLIEDDESNANILSDMFTFDGIPAKLVAVASGEEALHCASTLQPALILMDLRLPGIDGLETTQLLKADPRTKGIAVWAITAYAMNGDEERARAAGCLKYLTKPVNQKELAGRIREFLEERHEEEILECSGKRTS